jgi:hypothetical protein
MLESLGSISEYLHHRMATLGKVRPLKAAARRHPQKSRKIRYFQLK